MNSGNQPLIESHSAKVLTVGGFQFKDLNKNGKLDKFEDWRLSSEERAKDLLAQMTVEEKVGMMLISDTRMKNEWSMGEPEKNEPITSDFNESDMVSEKNMFTGEPLPYPVMNAAGTAKGR